MYAANNALHLSASDLVNHLACKRLTQLDYDVACGRRAKPSRYDPTLEQLIERGLDHEQKYIEHLKAAGREVTDVGGADVGLDDATVAATVQAMREGRDVIVQGALADGRWSGRADVLMRVDAPSKLGDWSYEVTDTKLARETKGGTILQLSLYSDLVARVQGRLPENMHVVAPWTEFAPQSYRVNDYAAYYRLVRDWLEKAVADTNPTHIYPEPRPHCEICRWSDHCNKRRRDDDHLSFVAGILRHQQEELKGNNAPTMARLAAMPVPLRWRPQHGAAASYEKVREQARLQVQSRETGEPVYEPLTPEPDVGFALLPEPSPGDIFFDFEGDPFVGPNGLEYLFGYQAADDNGELRYTGLWALDYEEEKRTFERFVDWLMARWQKYPDMHVYHYAPYEPSAMKRMMGRHATREDEVDRMLRGNLFVDLLRVVRGGLRAGVESYSIKELERFYGFQRDVSLPDANHALYKVNAPLEQGDPSLIAQQDMDAVEGYNRDDCESTFHLREWLESVRAGLVAGGADIARPETPSGAPSQDLDERQQRVMALAESLSSDVPADPDKRTDEEHSRWLLANILDWHRREEKAVWWEYYRLRESSLEELIDERAALANLKFVKQVDAPGRTPVHRYRYPVQDTNLRGGQDLCMPGGDKLGTLRAIDTQNRTVDIKKRGDTAAVHPEAAFVHELVRTDALKNTLMDIGCHVANNGIVGDGPYSAARDLLLRKPPRLDGEPIRKPGETPLCAAKRIAARGSFGVLPVQGPPGAGKTFTGARMIAELVRNGKRVGICANSHKVIVNLLKGVFDAADEQNLDVRAVRKVSDYQSGEPEDDRVTLTTDNGAVFRRLGDDCQIGAGTAWLWARPEAQDSVDALFVDEAGQMSLANALAISHAAPNLVLLGDPQQLDQPTLGTHPDGTDVSALAHLLDGRRTIECDKGLFMDKTFRMHPDVCSYTSEAFYEGRLDSRPGLDRQRVISDGPISGTGLRFRPVEHAGNQSHSDEEADVVASLARGLVDGRSSWIDQDGRKAPLKLKDVLIIAPYNAQVSKIQERLPSCARVGTVDKFQGQEAPVVIYSMATSTPEDAPHGMEFLYSLNRLNVATSRARCVSVLVGSPALFAPECRTPRQMRLANGFCRYLEMAEVVGV